MAFRLECLLLVLVLCSLSANARNLAATDATEVDLSGSTESAQIIVKNKKLCTLCEEFASQALFYLNENQTQEQIISTLHNSCLRMHSLKQQCKMLVDYYVPLFFLEISTMQPDQFCEKVNLCGETVLARQLDAACTFCHGAVAQMLIKLNDPDTKLDLVEALLKGCNKVENHVQECKKLVFEYAPLLLINAQSFLEANDVCTLLHVCKESQGVVIGSAIASA